MTEYTIDKNSVKEAAKILKSAKEDSIDFFTAHLIDQWSDKYSISYERSLELLAKHHVKYDFKKVIDITAEINMMKKLQIELN